jgi:hypothetical protein
MKKNIPVMSILTVVTAVVSALPVALFAQEPIISTEVSARGKREHLIKAAEWGRYAIETESGEDVSVTVVDKMRGVIAKSEANGGKGVRLDLFLEAGEYKLFTDGPSDARGNVRLSVTKFASVGAGGRGKGGYEYLPPFEQIPASLADKEARGWWLFVPRDTLVYIEALGRRLGCLAVFRGGERLVAQASNRIWSRIVPPHDFEFVMNESVPGKPLTGLRIAKRLERGKYLVMVYGGDMDRYTVSDSASPLYVNWMLTPIEPARPLFGKVGASGVNRYMIYPADDRSSGMTHIVAEVLGPQRLVVESRPIDGYNRRIDVWSDTLNRRAQSGGQARAIDVGHWAGTNIISVSGAPGTEFKITPANHKVVNTAFPYITYKPAEDGAYRLTAAYVPVAEDNYGASGVLVDMKDSSIVALKADTLSAARPLRRTFNIIGNSHLAVQSYYVWVDEAGIYTFTPAGDVDYQWRVLRFYVEEPRNYRRPDWNVKRSDVSLNRGLYNIQAIPLRGPGRAAFTFSLNGAGAEGGTGRQTSGRLGSTVTLGPFNLKNGRTYRFYMNALWMREFSSVHIEKYPPPEKENIADVYLTGAAADKADSSAAKASELALGVPHYVTLGRKSEAAYGFRVKEPGIYKIETTGRLYTKLTLCDRFGAVSRSESGNGVGRNARVAEFFLPGEYLVVAETEGNSAGRMGIVFSKGELRKGGALSDGVDKRAAVPANSAVVYDFIADKKALYSFESFGASGGAQMRLEDSGGWPLFKHGAEAPQEAMLEKGAYKVYSLPAPYDNYRVTRVDAAKASLKISGAGPHSIAVNEPVSAVWVESGAPARFLFEVSAPLDAKVALSPDFQGSLKFQGKDAAPVSVNGVYGGVLQKGRYELAVTPVKPQNYSPYELSITTDDLIPGIDYPVDSDKTLRVRVGERGEYEIFSQGRGEVSARLYAEDKKTEIARSGGDQLDWNFFISERLDSGSYYLRLSGFAPQADPPAKVFMRRAEDTVYQQVKLDSSTAAVKIKVRLSGKQVVIPISAQFGDVLSVSASGGSQLVCDLETVDKSSAAKRVSVGRRRGKRVDMSAVMEKGAAYTLRIRSDDRAEDVASVEIWAAEALPLTFEAALGGVTGQASKETGNTVFYKIDGITAGPGHFELVALENGLSRAAGTSGENGLFEEEEESAIIASAGKRLFVEAAFKSPDKYRFVMLPVSIPDIRELREKNREKFETADKYRFSKNRTAFTEREELPVVIKKGGAKVFVIDTPVQKLCLVTLAMPAGQPLVGLSAPARSADFVRNGIPVTGGQYFGGGVSKTAIIPGDTGRVVGWNAQTGGAAGVNAVFSMKSYKLEKADTLRTGRTAWTAKRSLAKEYRIAGSNGGYVVAVKLSPHTGVLYVSPDGIRDMYYGGDDGAQHGIEPAGGRFFLFGKTEGDGESDGSIELEMYAASALTKKGGAQPGALTVGAESVKHLPVGTREIVRIKNDSRQASRLYWSGSVERVDWVNRSGVITQGVKDGGKLSGQGGVLSVSYGEGAGKLRLCKDDGDITAQNACRWGEPFVKKDSLPNIKENSRLTLAHGVNYYAIDVPERANISLVAGAPAAAVFIAEEKVQHYCEFWEDMQWGLTLAAGKYTVGIKPLTGGSLSGIPLTVSFYPVLQLTERKPLQVQLVALQHKFVEFNLTKKSKIGIGLSTQGPPVLATLIGNGKDILAEGHQIFKELDKGRYLVLLSMLATQGTANVTVRLFGQDNPPADPPVELINWIIRDGRGERP